MPRLAKVVNVIAIIYGKLRPQGGGGGGPRSILRF